MRLKRGFKQSLVIGFLIVASGCGKQSFNKINGPSCNGSDVQCLNQSGYNYYDYNIQTEPPNTKTDILIVDDNSLSMAPEQQELGAKFPSLISQLAGLDWRIAITTTDMNPSSPAEVSDGNLVKFDFTNAKRFLFAGMMSNTDLYNSFRETVVREEIGYGDERGIWAAKRSLERRNEFGFIRDEANLAVIILSDEDERSNGNTQTPIPVEGGPLEVGKDRPSDLIGYINNQWNGEKFFQAHAIIIEPILAGDSSDEILRKENCKTTQGNQNAAIFPYYGNTYYDLVKQTGGVMASVCAADYSAPLRKIGEVIDQMISSQELACVPDMSDPAHSLKVYKKLSNESFIEHDYVLSGQRVTFDPALPGGTEIRLQFRCIE